MLRGAPLNKSWMRRVFCSGTVASSASRNIYTFSSMLHNAHCTETHFYQYVPPLSQSHTGGAGLTHTKWPSFFLQSQLTVSFNCCRIILSRMKNSPDWKQSQWLSVFYTNSGRWPSCPDTAQWGTHATHQQGIEEFAELFHQFTYNIHPAMRKNRPLHFIWWDFRLDQDKPNDLLINCWIVLVLCLLPTSPFLFVIDDL